MHTLQAGSPSVFDLSDSLTPLLFGLTTFFEVGIGLIAFVGLVYVAPWLKKRSDIYLEENRRLAVKSSWGNKYLDYAFPVTKYPNGKPRFRLFFILYLFARGSVYIGLGGDLLNLILAKAWIFGGSLDKGIVYNLVFARASDTPDGAHIVSAIGLPIVGFLVIYLYRDEFLGALVAAFIVGIHEGLWEPLYYIWYAKFLDWSLLIYVLKDISFGIMCGLFILALWKYPKRPFPMRILRWPITVYIFVLGIWSAVGFPISTINNFKIGTTIYHITQWWGNPYVEGLEVWSWATLCFMFGMAIYLYWRKH